jgi:hypothetical protein
LDVKIIDAEYEHCEKLIDALSPEQIEEIKKFWDEDPLYGLKTSVMASGSMCWTAVFDGKVAGMFGCAEDEASARCCYPVGIPWFQFAPMNDAGKIRFIRAAPAYLDLMKNAHDVLVNWTPSNDRKFLRWLRSCGFTIEEQEGGLKRCVWSRPSLPGCQPPGV